jgi:hypothetical protein
LNNANAAGCAESQVVGAEWCSSQADSQLEGFGERLKGLTPCRCLGVIWIQPQVVCLIGNRHAAISLKLSELFL